MNPDLRVLISLQDIDQKIAALQKQISQVPGQIQSLRDELARVRQAHEDRAARGQELAKRRRGFEGEVDLLRTKLARLKDQLMAVKTNKEYTAMLHEIQGVEAQIRGEEDKILEIMEETEGLDRDIAQSSKDVAARAVELEGSIRRLEEEIPALTSEVGKLQTEKSGMEERVAEELLRRYRQIAEYRRGIAVAEARDELCTACHVRIRPQVYANLRFSETIVTCDSCNRILFVREAAS